MFNVIEGHLIDMISLNDANYAFYIHQMNRVNSMALPWWQHHKHCHGIIIIIIIIIIITTSSNGYRSIMR